MDVRTYRKTHRWLGLIVGIQLILWTASGLFFSLNSIAKVRGETEAPDPSSLTVNSVIVSPSVAISQLVDTDNQIEIQSVLLRPHLEGSVYEIAYLQEGVSRWALAEPSTGELLRGIDEHEALEIATQAYLPDSQIAEVELITESGPGTEYRGRPVPAYRVTYYDPLGTRLYVSVERGIVTARRNDRWRWFDFLWMLHIMDYEHRDNFNTLLLQAVSALGLVTVLSGFFLAGVTSSRVRRIIGRG